MTNAPQAHHSRLQLMEREGCHLCEVAAAHLEPLAQAAGVSVQRIDITSDENLLRRYSHEVPVVIVDGEPVCVLRVDAKKVSRALRDGPTARRSWWRR